jgi:hypothetical protein
LYVWRVIVASHNTRHTHTHIHKRQTSMPLVGFKPEIPAIKWPQTHTVDCVATTVSRDLLEKMWGAHSGVAAENTSLLGCDIVGQELPSDRVTVATSQQT